MPESSTLFRTSTILDDQIQPGALLAGTYRITGPLAEGGCGEVYTAAHARLPGQFAVKLLHRRLLGDREAEVRFRQEAEITSTLRHPNIVHVVDFNETETGRPFLVMELLEGDLLSERLARIGPMPAARAAAIVEQIARALLAAHERGIVHRDLKPDNVMLVSAEGLDDFVKVLDFGISRASWRENLRDDAQILGTPEYMAPEQARGESERIGPWTDQWALAAIAYLLLTGREPFRGHSISDVLSEVVLRDPVAPSELLPALSAEVSAVVLRGLCKDPAGRHEGVDAFAAALRAAVEAVGAIVVADAPPEPLRNQEPVVVVATGADARLPSCQVAALRAPTRTLRLNRRAARRRARLFRRTAFAGALAVGLSLWLLPINQNHTRGAMGSARPDAHGVFAWAAAEWPDAAARLYARLALLLPAEWGLGDEAKLRPIEP